jgi:hypothetical protein
MKASPIREPKNGIKLVMVTVTASSSNAKAVAKSMNFIFPVQRNIPNTAADRISQ